MRLLVSVRAVDEVAAALNGGADIIDAKEPSQGSLGAVGLPLLGRMISQVPARQQLSIAMGDLTTLDGMKRAIESLPARSRRAPTYLKFGFAGVSSGAEVENLLAAAVATARTQVLHPQVIAVAYADSELADGLDPEAMVSAAVNAGAAGVLLDTYHKAGPNLLGWIDALRLSRWLGALRQAGLVSAVAGSLTADDLGPLHQAGADVVGFRGAACTGGRMGSVSRARVQRLKETIRQLDSGFLQAG